MADFLILPPNVKDLPLSKGRDLYLQIVYKPLLVDGSNNPILDGQGKPQYVVANYPGGATIKLEIDTTPKTTVNGTITTSVATFLLDYLLVDVIKAGLLYRVKITYSSGIDDVLVNGKTARKDGK